jgi:hypothetical protein
MHGDDLLLLLPGGFIFIATEHTQRADVHSAFYSASYKTFLTSPLERDNNPLRSVSMERPAPSEAR